MPIKTQSALINPYTLPAPQNAAEEEFAKCMAAGIPYRIGKGRPEKPINKGCRTTPEDREKDNVIRASVIKFFAWGGDEDNLMRGDVIDLQGVWVTGALDLTGASFPMRLYLQTAILSNAWCCHTRSFVSWNSTAPAWYAAWRVKA